MAYIQKEGNGSLFKNDRKEKDTHPDWTGSIMINGEERWLSAWTKQGQKGEFFSLNVGDVKKPKASTSDSGGYQANDDDLEDLPF